MFPDGGRRAMIEGLAHLLGNTCRLQRIAQRCEWRVTGPCFIEAAALFRRQAAEMFSAQSRIASRIRTLGGVAIPDEGDLLLSPREMTLGETADQDALLHMLAGGHRRMIESIRAASDVAIDIDDRGSLLLLDQRLVSHERHMASLAIFAG